MDEPRVARSSKYFFISLCTYIFSKNILKIINMKLLINVWRYQKCNQKEVVNRSRDITKQKGQKDKNTRHDTENIRSSIMNQLKTRGERRCSERERNSCSARGTRIVTLVTNTVISHTRGNNLIIHTTNGTYRWSFMAHTLNIFYCSIRNN